MEYMIQGGDSLSPPAKGMGPLFSPPSHVCSALSTPVDVDVEFEWRQISPAPFVNEDLDVDVGWRPPRHPAQVQKRAFSIRFGSAH